MKATKNTAQPKPIAINNGQVWALAALYAKKFVCRDTTDSMEDFVKKNLEVPYFAFPSQLGTGVSIAFEIVKQFGADYRIQEFKAVNKIN